MSQLVTRCPHCSTSFHVSEQQLRAARGAVRCGSCLQVFRADENIVFNERDPQPASKKAIEELLEDDDFLIHDDIDLDGDDEDLPRPKKTSQPPGKAPPEDQKPGQNPVIDDAFGEQQWQDLDRETEESAEEQLDIEAEIDQLGVISEDPWAEEIAREESSRTDSRPPALKPEEDLFAEQYASPKDTITPAEEHDFFSTEEAQTSESAPADEEPFSALPDDHLDAAEMSERHLDTGQLEAAPLLPKDQLISAIGPAPIEMTWQPKRHNRVPTWLWAVGSVILLLGLIAQTAYFQFDALSKRDPWRNLYAQVCPIVGCKLPPQVDINAIHTANLVVRSHPQIPGALAVEAVLLNRAPFDQPFPTLQLRFTDLKNAPVASRRFNPRDYLRGELSGRQLMPAGNPVHIALDIVDPGSDAVNYELRISPQ
ncbi:DUF3426 domain-containing protein [Microbulbifer sp. HZ11]|uniref:DUF3426 domain-containing protein n=1 Tax=Microbulbifer sp. HZ11 TaxID=1453501 RepID=UPI0005BD7D7F|nr:DUF3426 domain-containing protein [Microbulbifer sp. HZ11]